MNESEEKTFEEAICMGEVTHADPRCAISVAAVSALIRALCRGEIKTDADLNAVVERAWTYVKQSRPDISLDREEFHKHAYAESLDELVLCDQTMGYVYKCLGASLWCLRRVVAEKETFKSALTKLIMFGGDADTNGAVAGALMGAQCGYMSLPAEWRDGLKYEEWYREKIRALCVVAGLIEGTYDNTADPDTELDGGKGFLTEEDMRKREGEIWKKMSEEIWPKSNKTIVQEIKETIRKFTMYLLQ
jgi:ADP-ribosylglycohydrolase